MSDSGFARFRRRFWMPPRAHGEVITDLERFFEECDALEGPTREPDWEEHLAIINESRLSGISGT